MGCLAPDTLAALGDGLLPSVRWTEVDAHLDTCAHCRELVSDFLERRSVGEQGPAPVSGPDPLIR